MVTHRIIKEDDSFVANCPELGISSQGGSIEEADNNLKEAVSCYLDTTEDLGIREEIFKQKNIILHMFPENTSNTLINVPINPGTFVTANSITLSC
jgi:predicted RNase H-like HicB family nuclease